ncbi:exopolysaccharide Pel transporter PelG [Bacillus sp. RO3]|nr:exopolysaccharide Pel transporter PelG [Bacillus sp. RO3]
MAGIGFQLQKLFKEDYFSSRVKAYGFSVMVTSGPWLIIIVSLAMSQWMIGNLLSVPVEVRELLNITLAYCFIFSQLVFSIQQLTVTRYVADELYEKSYERVFPAFLGLSKSSSILGAVFILLFLWMSPLPLYYEWIVIVFYLIMLMNWNCFLFVSALKDYKKVTYSFLIGGVLIVLGIFGAITFVDFGGWDVFQVASMLLIPFIAGMLTTLLSLFMILSRSFLSRTNNETFQYLRYLDYFPKFIIIGFFYTAGLWVANWVIWFGEGAEQLFGFFRYHPVYDAAVFWSYLSIVPTLMFFVISVETRFYPRYRSFYGYINEGGSLQQIQQSKRRMQEVLKEELFRLLRNQAVFTLLFILLAGWFGELIHAHFQFVPIFRLTLIGAFANAMILVFQLLMLYFEDQKGAMYTSILFFSSILILSLLFLPMGMNGYGLSFSIGSLLTFLFAAFRLYSYLGDLDYYAFTQGNVKSTKRFFSHLVKKLYDK